MLHALLAWLVCGWVSVAHAGPQVLVVLSENAAPHREAAEAMRVYLQMQDAAIALRTVVADQAGSPLPEADILLAVGARAMEAVAHENRPTLNILVPRQSFEVLRSRAKADSRLFTAIYLDQPLARQFRLIKQLLPGRSRVGVLLGPVSLERIKPLQQAAHEQQLALDIEQVAKQDAIFPALKRVLVDDQVLLALPDPLIFNANTAQSVLLTSYRAQTPLIAYSKSYVQAGALAAVYSTPAQIGQQAAEILLRALHAKSELLPPPQYPKYFSISVNYQVGRSLGLSLEDEATLLERIKAGAGRD
jgi:putative ABC transport system substrate-binding protein